MSMLAERRRKTKWYNPGRQALWNRESDGTKFGRELMEKMGWKIGQGLGVNQQGIKVPLKIGFKNDNTGMGYKENDNEWIQQQSEFDELLGKLSSDVNCNTDVSKDSNKNAIQSLEEKSRLSKARVHYNKFTRGKDLAKYSKKDLECILGRNERETSTHDQSHMESTNNNHDPDEEVRGLITVNAGSMVDYFARKIKNKNVTENLTSDVKQEMDESPPSGNLNEDMKENAEDSAMELNEKKKKSKKKKEKDKDYNSESYYKIDDNLANDCEMEPACEGHKEKKKKSKKKKEKDKDCNYESYDRMDDNLANDCQMEPACEVQKEKKKKKQFLPPADESNLLGESKDCVNVIAKNELTEMPEEERSIYESSFEVNEVSGGKLKKKKKMRKKEENPSEEFATNNEEALNDVEDEKNRDCRQIEEKAHSLTSTEASKKKKKSKRNYEVIIDEGDDAGDVKEKTKTKKRCLEAENLFNEEESMKNKTNLNDVDYTETNHKKDKRKKDKNSRDAVVKDEECVEGVEIQQSNNNDSIAYEGELLKNKYQFERMCRNKLLNLIYYTNIEQFSGSNLGGLMGYGTVSYNQ